MLLRVQPRWPHACWPPIHHAVLWMAGADKPLKPGEEAGALCSQAAAACDACLQPAACSLLLLVLSRRYLHLRSPSLPCPTGTLREVSQAAIMGFSEVRG